MSFPVSGIGRTHQPKSDAYLVANTRAKSFLGAEPADAMKAAAKTLEDFRHVLVGC